MPYSNYDWITDRLAVGGMVSDSDDLPFDAVLSMETSAPPAVADLVRSERVEYRWESIIDGYCWEEHDDIVRRFDAAAKQIHAWIGEDKRVLVHCASGVSRAVTAATWYLVRYEGLSWDDAFHRVRTARPVAYPNPRLWLALRVASGEVSDWETAEALIADYCSRLAEHNATDSPEAIAEDLERQGTWTRIPTGVR